MRIGGHSFLAAGGGSGSGEAPAREVARAGACQGFSPPSRPTATLVVRSSLEAWRPVGRIEDRKRSASRPREPNAKVC